MVWMLRSLSLALIVLAGSANAQDASNPWAASGWTPLPLPTVEGALTWDALAAVDLVMHDNGLDMVPAFSDDLQALKGETVTLVGYLMPLDSDGRRVLLSMNSPHCPFCMPGGPETFVELFAERPLELVLEPVAVEGKLELLDERWTGYYYRMADVRVVPFGS